MQSWTPHELAAYLLNDPQSLKLLDVREPWEYDIAHIQGATLIPLGKLAQDINTLERNTTYVVICHHGIRSAHACYFLERNGFQTINLTGGIDRWAQDIDRDMPLY